MSLEFSFKYKDYELRACPKRLARFSPEEPNETIDFVKWNKSEDKPYCFSLAFFERYSEGYRLKFVGDRPFEYIDKKDLIVVNCYKVSGIIVVIVNRNRHGFVL